MLRLVCRMPLQQTEQGAMFLGKLVVDGLSGAEMRKTTRELLMADTTREAVVLWLNAVNNARMRSTDLVAFENLPIRVNNRLRFGDVFAEED